MSEELTKELTSVLKQHLPAMAADSVLSQLNELPGLRKQLLKSNKTIEKQQTIIQSLTDEVSDWQKKDVELTERENDLQENQLILQGNQAALEDAERKLTEDQLRYQLESEREKTNFTKEVALGLVRNTTYRKNVIGNKDSSNGVDEYGTPRPTTTLYNNQETTETHE